MSNHKVSYEDALEFFQSHELYWEVILESLLAKREAYIANLKRNAETPVCDDRTDAKAIGGMIAIDDIYYDFKVPAKPKE